MAAALAEAERLIAAVERRRGSGEIVDAAGVAGAVTGRLREYGTVRALLAGDPVLEELGVPGAAAAAGAEVLVWPEGRGLGWRDLLGLDGTDDTCGITAPLLGVAERGTLVLSTGPHHGRSIDVVTRRHLAVLPASRVAPTLDAALPAAFRGGGRVPSAVSLVSGPSRSSDIEKISTLGAHGALSVHVLVVADR